MRKITNERMNERKRDLARHSENAVSLALLCAWKSSDLFLCCLQIGKIRDATIHSHTKCRKKSDHTNVINRLSKNKHPSLGIV